MNKKTIWSLVAVVVLVLLGFWAARHFAKNEPARELVASSHPAWPPIMYQAGDQIIGAGPEIVAKIFSELGVKVASRSEGAWDMVQEKAKSGALDVLDAAYKTTERETYMDYSIPYTVDPVVLVVKHGKAFAYDKWEDLIGKKGVVMTGDSYGQDFDNFLKEKLNPTKVATPAEAFALLDKGEADYFVYALYSAKSYIAQNKIADKVDIIAKYVSSENFYITISKKSPFLNLLPRVNALLEKYKADGTIDRIIEKYKQALWGDGLISSAKFNCAENKSVQAVFFKDRVELSLSDGRNMTLPQTISASGARYANSDESLVFWNKGDGAFIEENNQTTFSGCLVASSAATSTSAASATGPAQAPAQMANPASVNCTKVGGTLSIQKRGDGGEYGLCNFEDNRSCEEWALMRGDCPVGGMKTTGFDTIDQKYCAWSGGQTLAVPNSVCTFKDGSKCPTVDFYDGKCSPGKA